MSKKSKRTSAPAPMVIPPPVPHPVLAPGTQHVPPPSIPSMFGPGMWCLPRPPQSVPPSSSPYWLSGGIQQPGMTGSSTQGTWWTSAGIDGSRHSWPAVDHPEESDVQAWGLHSHPPGGFLNMLKSTPQAASNGTVSLAIHIDSDNNDVDYNRSEKRLTWTKDEDLRLVSAWLNNSNDPIQANFKKNDQYWDGVADVFNSTTPKNRVRSAKQIKDHFGRIKKRVAWFCGNWKEANAMWASGESDDDVMNKALQSYEEDHKKDGPFGYRHCWEVLSKEPKWDAYLERLKDLEPEKRKFSVDEDVGQQFSLDDVRDERPIGGRKAKEQRKKKKKDQTCIIDIEDELHSFLDAQKAANEGRTEMLETQRHVSSEKLESRMNRRLFLRIVDALGQWSPYFTYRADCAGRIGLSPLQKCTAAMRMLAYGSPADALDEYLKIGKSTALQCLDKFARGVIEVFRGEYLRRPTREDVERLLQVNESRGFPGMLGSIDCMHWRWEKCPLAWRGQFTRGDYGVPTMVLEAVASQDLHIWHAFFGVAGSNNDLNVLNQSPLFFMP